MVGSQQQQITLRRSLSGSRSYLRHSCQGAIVKESWNEQHNTVVVCANIGGVITSLWCEAERQRKEVYTRSSINCAVRCGLSGGMTHDEVAEPDSPVCCQPTVWRQYSRSSLQTVQYQSCCQLVAEQRKRSSLKWTGRSSRAETHTVALCRTLPWKDWPARVEKSQLTSFMKDMIV